MRQNSLRKNRIFVWGLIISLVVGCICILYFLFGHQLVKAVYEGRSAGVLNRIIEGQSRFPLEVYYRKADAIFISYLILFSLSAILFITFRLLINWDLLNSLVAVSVLMALLFFSALITEKILWAPFGFWSSARLTWTFSLVHRYKMYYPAYSGPALSGIYGPIGPLVYLPVTLVNSPTPAVMLGLFISTCFYFLPMLWLHIGRNLLNLRRLLFALCAFACFCLFTFNTRALYESAFWVHVDAPALGIGAIGCAILYYRKNKDSILFLLLSAIFSVFAVWTKQTLMPLLLALSTYTLLADGYKCFRRYILYICISGIILSALFLWIFDARVLFFSMFTIPSHHTLGGNTNPIVALFNATFDLIKESFLPAIILIILSVYSLRKLSNIPDKLKTWISSNRWTMLIIVSLFMVPTSVLGKAKIAGSENNLSPSVYFLVAAATLALIDIVPDILSCYAQSVQRSVKLLFVLLITGLVCVNALRFREIPLLLQNISSNDQKVAYEYAKKYPGEAYFPNNPLSSLLAEGKLYHFNFGLIDRELAGFPVSREHFWAHIPADIRLVAFPKIYQNQAVMKYLPEFSKRVTIDELPGWIVYMRE